MADKELDNLCINTIRFLAADTVQRANSGHPGTPMGAAPMAYVLWDRFLKHNPGDLNGRTGTGLSSRRATLRHCFIRSFTSPGTTCPWKS